MKINNYKNDPRWDKCSPVHREHGVCPNWFVTALLSLDHTIIKNINIAIETGTFEGNTSCFFGEVFDKVYTVEKFVENNYYTSLDLLDLYNEIRKTYNNINFHTGDSGDFLRKILPIIEEPCVILLDAHNGGETPVVDELVAIKETLKHTNSIILIDDMVDAGTGSWPSREKIQNLLLDINPNYKIQICEFGRQILMCYE